MTLMLHVTVDEQIGQLYELMRALQRESEEEDDPTGSGKE